MNPALKNILIGIFVACAIALIIFTLLFLHPKVGDQGKTLIVRFTDIDKVNIGTRVTFAGRPVGEVVSIKEIPNARLLGENNKNGDIYIYELALKVDSKVEVFNTDCISLRTSGLLGERNIEINPCPPASGVEMKQIDHDVLYAIPPITVEDTMKQLGAVASKVGQVFDDVHQLMKQIQDEKLIENLGIGLKAGSEIITTLNQPEEWKKAMDHILGLAEEAHLGWGKMDQFLNSLVLVSNQLDENRPLIQQGISSFSSAMSQGEQLLQNANAILAFARNGEGNIGHLFFSDDLYLRIKSILHKGEKLVDDIQSYGLLFQTNRRWQRLHARRIRLLEKLATPEDFYSYFHDEVGSISASLTRVCGLLDQCESYPCSLTQNPCFVHDFSELLRKVETMEDSLKSYNDQLMEDE